MARPIGGRLAAGRSFEQRTPYHASLKGLKKGVGPGILSFEAEKNAQRPMWRRGATRGSPLQPDRSPLVAAVRISHIPLWSFGPWVSPNELVCFSQKSL